MPIILASSSPQRKRILENLGIKFTVVPAHIDEHHDGLTKPHAIVKSIAKRKAEAVAAQHPKAWVIGCDTIVVLRNGQISLKPEGRADAKKTLKLYQNSYCDVYSGLALVNQSLGKSLIGFERTRIFFNDFPDSELETYLDEHPDEWKGSSGSLTIESCGAWIRKMEGEYWNVVGLPVDLLKKEMKSLGL